MRTVIIVDEGSVQIDLVPENERDKLVLSMIRTGTTMKVGKSSGYAMSGAGFMRPFDGANEVGFTFIVSDEQLLTEEGA